MEKFRTADKPDPFAGCTACCFTGHRPNGLPAPDSAQLHALTALLERTVHEACRSGVRLFLCGGAQGFDQMAAEAVLREKANRADIRLSLALPAPTQADRWPHADRTRYEAVKRRADEVWYASDLCNAAAFLARNRRLVDRADCCIAYLAKPSGGTLYTVQYAQTRGIPVLNLASRCRK